ncbi:NAD(P)-binding domain protein [Akanthomyces lecanii RCEF 1005]|uniref:NAD(P)-binding domain protein n=1 Tax=Akanthomyces lecanii RCEF 1005 TaxID=1081108 RepID=A0A162KK27_CORDF|nr:NAD(P)-binding domain protein [Akanthomyces lecanii RCEF 1005]
MAAKEHVVVIGAGVIGLTIALQLQTAGFDVLILAKDFPGPFETLDFQTQINFASPWAGAHNGWGRDLPGDEATPEDWRDHRCALQTFARMTEIQAKHPEAGLTFVQGFEYFDDPPEHIKNLNDEKAAALGIQDFRLLPREDLPKGVTFGYSFRTWCLNPMVYCCFLLRKFANQGGKMQKRELRSSEEAFAVSTHRSARFVVNASGSGFNDDKVFITRGQTCVVANPCDVSISRHYADGSTSFCIPRNFDGGTIIGGTQEPNDWSPDPTPGLRLDLLKKLAETYPQILSKGVHFKPLRDIVGRRPTRKGGMRLEKEEVGLGRIIVHAYGAGGRGYELSWGVAKSVGSVITGASGAL